MENPMTYNELIDLLHKRYSCREYDPGKSVDNKLVLQVVEAARLAQSAVNRQPWTFIAVTSDQTKARILCKSRPAFMQAPVVIVACGHHESSWHRPADGKDHTDVDLAIAIENMCLAAASLGLGCCWVCSFDVEATCKALDLPPDVEPVALLPLGFPLSDDIPEKNRKPMDDIFKWEKF